MGSDPIYVKDQRTALKSFMSRDPWKGTGWYPGTLNYYTYGFNNPVKFSDPSGYCPGPIPENGYHADGKIICIAGFIPTAESEGPFGLIYAGDDRWFSSNSGLAKSRFWVWIDVETGSIVDSFVNPTIAINDYQLFGTLGGECDGSTCIYSQPDWTSRLASVKFDDSGLIVFNYSVLCSHPTCYLGPGPDGIIAFTPIGAGEYAVLDGYVDRFPNMEAYYWENGQVKQTLFQINFFSQPELGIGRINLCSGLNMYGGLPLGQPPYWFQTMPWWWQRGNVGH